ncbi:MAG: ankyrin repeat domain-containing protein [Sedimentisphaerales bacterium]
MTHGATALLWAARAGHTEVVNLLLEKGAEVNVKDNNGKTALGMAKLRSYADIVQLLEKAGAKE